MIDDLHKDIMRLSDPTKAQLLQRYFKTGPGDYAQGDRFVGISVPQLRKMAKNYADLPYAELQKLITSPIHEERFVALIIATMQFSRGDEAKRKELYDFYLKNTRHINNWDLVDCSSHKIVGAYLIDKDRAILYRLVRSPLLWDRRIAIISTFAFIRTKHYDDALAIAELLLYDKHDLIHKATGWMLREVGKSDEKVLRGFLDKHSQAMPRTMLRYAIERLPQREKAHYMQSTGHKR